MIFGRQYCAGWYNLFENALMILLMTTWLVASDQSHSQQREEVGLSPLCQTQPVVVVVVVRQEGSSLTRAHPQQWTTAHPQKHKVESSSNMSYWRTIANRGSARVKTKRCICQKFGGVSSLLQARPTRLVPSSPHFPSNYNAFGNNICNTLNDLKFR